MKTNNLNEGKDEGDMDPWISRKLLLPIARGLCVNWETGNRREAGETLSHITGSGPEASAIVSAMPKTFKKVCQKRFIECGFVLSLGDNLQLITIILYVTAQPGAFAGGTHGMSAP